MGEYEIDMVNRDPNNLNSNVSVAFDDVFGEPESTHSTECSWNCTYKCYTGAKKICYLIITTLCGWLCGCCWGCDFACLVFYAVYCYTPMIKQFTFALGMFKNLLDLVISCVIGPCCAALGLFFSNIKVTQG